MQRNKVIWIGIAIILVFTPIGRGTVRIWSIAPVLPIALLVFIWLWKANNNSMRLCKTRLDKPIFAFVVLAAISFIFSIYKHDSFYALLRLFGYVGIFYLIVNNYDRRMRRYLIGLVICIGASLSIYGLLQYFGILPHPWWVPKDFLAATYVNHNHFSGYLELVIPVAIGALIHYRSINPTIRLALIEALIVMAAAFIFAQSRGGWISLAISLVLMNAILIKKRLLNKKSIFILILLIFLIFSFAYSKSEFVSKRIDTFAEITKGEASPQTRLKMWQGSIDMIRDNPLIGTGIGTFVWGFPRYRPEGLDNVRVYSAHNDYLHTAAEMGILALLIMFWLLTIVIGKGLTKMNSHPVVLGCSIGMLSLAIHGLVDFNFHITANMVLFTVYAAIVMSESRLQEVAYKC